MEKQLTYKDVKKEMPIEDVLKNFEKKNSELKELLEMIKKAGSNSERKSIDYHILSATIKELYRINTNGLNNETLALSTRNVFELNMIYQYTCLCEENLCEWIGNNANDQIEIYEGILKLSENHNSEDKKTLKDTIDTIRTNAKNKNYKISKQLTTRTLAEKVGLIKEYEGLFKLYSKFIHPTSFLINSNPDTVNALQFKNIFLIQFQIYTSDLESRLRDFYTSKADQNATTNEERK
jgi:hypothetical protein